jgi:hypothetical protein
MGCIRLFYPNFTNFIVLCHKGSLVISFPINGTPMVGGEDQAFNHPSPTPTHSCFLRGVGVLHGVRAVFCPTCFSTEWSCEMKEPHSS